MLTIAVLSGPGAASYYTRATGCERELLLDAAPPGQPGHRGLERDVLDYYVNGRDLPGEWIGSGAKALQLQGQFDPDAARVLSELLAGRHGGEQLVPPIWRKDTHGERVDQRRSGFDLTFSAPKSVSVLMALSEPEVVRQVVEAHRYAATEALGLLESLAARAARGHHGDGVRAPRIATEGFVGAAFTHTTSRALDPQLHTHVVIANLARGTDGRWSALDSRTMHREAITASHLYQHLLRKELTERLGVRWTGVDKGVAEIDGITQAVRREFSTRRTQIEAALTRDLPATGGKRALVRAAQAACLATRPKKRHAPAEQFRTDWADRAERAGFGSEQLQELLDQQASGPLPQVRLPEVLARVLAPEGVTLEDAVFTQGRLLREVIAQLPPGARITRRELLEVTAGLVQADQIVPVLTPDGRAYTTREVLETEQAALTLAGRQAPTVAGLDRQQTLQALGRDLRLRSDQRAVAFEVLTSGRGVEVITGPAGCGKTAGLALARQLWADAGIEVTGTAVAAIAAQGLETASGAPSVSLARVLGRPDRHIPQRGVLLVDEAGMIGTRQLHTLLTRAAERECKVVLVGDPQQLPEIEAGGLFARLADTPTALRIDGHHRQVEAWERDALTQLRLGHVDTFLDTLTQQGRLHTLPNAADTRTAAVTAYLTARDQHADPFQAALLAGSKDEVRVLNEHAQQQLLASRQLSRRSLTLETDHGPRRFHVGEQVLITCNDHTRGLLNGTTARVARVHRDGLTITTSLGQQVRVDRGWLEQDRLELGYAMTLHKAQGRTVHTAVLVGGDSLSTQGGYVGLSRGTHANHLFLAQPELADLTRDCAHAVQHRPAVPRPQQRALTRDLSRRLALERVREHPGTTRDLPAHRRLR